MELRALISFAGVVSAKKGEVFTLAKKQERIGKSLVEAGMAEVVKASAKQPADDPKVAPKEATQVPETTDTENTDPTGECNTDTSENTEESAGDKVENADNTNDNTKKGSK